MLAEVSEPDIAGSVVDFGLAPGARLRLVKMQSVHIRGPERYDALLERCSWYILVFVIPPSCLFIIGLLVVEHGCIY